MLHTFPAFTVTNVTAVDVTAKTYCTEIIIGEDPAVANYPTTDYVIYGVALDASAVRRVAGSEFAFRGPFSPGQKVGSVKTAAGSTSFIQAEQ